MSMRMCIAPAEAPFVGSAPAWHAPRTPHSRSSRAGALSPSYGGPHHLTPPRRRCSMLAHAGRVVRGHGGRRSTLGTDSFDSPPDQGRDSGGSCCSDSGAALKRKRPPLLEVDASISSWAPTLAQLRPHLHRRHSAPDGWKPDLPNVPADTDRGWPAPVRVLSPQRRRATMGTRGVPAPFC